MCTNETSHTSCMYSFPLHCKPFPLAYPGPIVNSNPGALCPLIPPLPFLRPHHPEDAYPLAILVLLACYQHLPHPSPTTLKLRTPALPENTCPTRPLHHNPPQTIHQKWTWGESIPHRPQIVTRYMRWKIAPLHNLFHHQAQGFGPVSPLPPPRPQILASLAKSNSATPTGWLS